MSLRCYDPFIVVPPGLHQEIQQEQRRSVVLVCNDLGADRERELDHNSAPLAPAWGAKKASPIMDGTFGWLLVAGMDVLYGRPGHDVKVSRLRKPSRLAKQFP